MLTTPELETSLGRVHEWIRAADQKVSIFLAFQGVIITILFPGALSWALKMYTLSSWPYILIGYVALALVGYSLYQSALTVIPRLAKDGNKKSITYFGDVARFSNAEFKKAVESCTSADYQRELIEQIHTSSKIATKKYGQFRMAIITFFSGLALLALDSVLLNCYD